MRLVEAASPEAQENLGRAHFISALYAAINNYSTCYSSGYREIDRKEAAPDWLIMNDRAIRTWFHIVDILYNMLGSSAHSFSSLPSPVIKG
jgi:hypothetical protein